MDRFSAILFTSCDVPCLHWISNEASFNVFPAIFAGYRQLFGTAFSLFSTLFGCAQLIVFRPMLGGLAVFPPAFSPVVPRRKYRQIYVFSDILSCAAVMLKWHFRGDFLLSRRSIYYRVVPRLDLISPSSTGLFWTFSSGIATGIYVLRRFKWMDFFGNSPVFASISDWPCWALCVRSRSTLILILQKLKNFLISSSILENTVGDFLCV